MSKSSKYPQQSAPIVAAQLRYVVDHGYAPAGPDFDPVVLTEAHEADLGRREAGLATQLVPRTEVLPWAGGTVPAAPDRGVQGAHGATREHSLACNMHPTVLVARENDRAEFAAAGRAERKRRNRAARRRAKRANASPLAQLQAQLRRLES